jgi:hypothetical protein
MSELEGQSRCDALSEPLSLKMIINEVSNCEPTVLRWGFWIPTPTTAVSISRDTASP